MTLYMTINKIIVVSLQYVIDNIYRILTQGR